MFNNTINIAFLIILLIPILIFILTLMKIVGEDMKSSTKKTSSSPYTTKHSYTKKQVKKQKKIHYLRKVK
ncbi:hypothetical protein [Clostridium formicaceticum]|uniref:Uncharacterized protein n=1 Tax=Clostridium formicaceticum TaxID=1497 RepID=A0AAC9WEH4_9CLOT|nr:hypothetical protein [Clostridium formicaceticum]AOY75470.1 hypothetical protein BJL90_05910 [Clostridium formicaceticum]ARE85756.1 hypothetical protein CLFO_00720 [Clostridium formicaceticum]